MTEREVDTDRTILIRYWYWYKKKQRSLREIKERVILTVKQHNRKTKKIYKVVKFVNKNRIKTIK